MTTSENDEAPRTAEGLTKGEQADSDVFDYALEIAVARGWKLFPCHSITRGECTCSKGADCPHAGKHPRTLNGVKDASADQETIAMWREIYPDANWALACGAGSGVMVVDVDRRGGIDGFDSLDLLALERGGLEALTGGGGLHVFVAYEAGFKNHNPLLPGIDFKTDGGYVILPPSRHKSGSSYQWHTLNEPVSVSPELRGYLTRPKEPALSRQGASLMDPVPEGGRNDALIRNLGIWRRKLDDDRPAVEHLAWGWGRSVGLDDQEIARTIESAWRLPHVDLAISWPLASPEEVDQFERMVGERLIRHRVEREAKQRFEIESRPEAPGFDVATLGEVLARADESAWRIDRLMPADASTLVVAQHKTGKTTLMLNLVRSLLTGSAFLGELDVDPVEQKVAMLNHEVSGGQIAQWADEAGVPHDRFLLVNLRDRRNPFAHADDRAALAAHLRDAGVETLIVDPFGRAFSGQNQDSASEVGAWLATLDEFARADVGARDVILTAHAGWEGERTRGSTALNDWPDAIWTMTKNERSGERHFKADGRDVSLDKSPLEWHEGRQLKLLDADARRSQAVFVTQTRMQQEILAVVKESPGCSRRGIEKCVGGNSAQLRQAIDSLVKLGWIEDKGTKAGSQFFAVDRPTGSEGITTPTDPPKMMYG